jgi:hypothetical protein
LLSANKFVVKEVADLAGFPWPRNRFHTRKNSGSTMTIEKYLLHGLLLSAGLGVVGCAGQSGSQSSAPPNSSAQVAQAGGDGHDHSSAVNSGADHGDAAHDAVAHTHGTTMQFSSLPQQVAAGQPATWTLKISNEDGTPLKDFAVVHDKLMHLIVVSKDLSWFNHVHPQYKGNGVFSLSTTLPRGGQYKLFADYTPKDGEHEVAQQELQVTGGNALPATAKLVADKMQGAWMIKRVTSHAEDTAPGTNGTPYQVALMPMPATIEAGKDVMLHFQVRDAQGKLLNDLQPYLGAMGHAVILSSDAKNYLHTHPTEGEHAGHGAMANGGNADGARAGATKSAEASTRGGPDVMFHTNFPTAGLYKVWVSSGTTVKLLLRRLCCGWAALRLRLQLAEGSRSQA